jgi:hypothetical protein
VVAPTRGEGCADRNTSRVVGCSAGTEDGSVITAKTLMLKRALDHFQVPGEAEVATRA